MSDEERIPPTRIRVAGLQEAHLPDLARIERECAEMHYQAGFDPSEVAPRDDVAIAKLFRTHDLFVAEADHEVAGYLAWRDEPPKVAMLEILLVAPALHRFGIGTRLLREMGESCQSHGIQHTVTRCWTKAPWAVAFLATMGFEPLGDDAPPAVADWRDRQQKKDQLAEPGQRVYWRATAELGVTVLPGIPRPT